MNPKTSLLRRLTLGFAALSLLTGIVPSVASAATQLYAVSNESAEIWRIDPVTGDAISKFALSPPIAMLLSGTTGPDGTAAIDLPKPGRLGADPLPIQVLMQDGTRVFLLDPTRVTPR